MTGVVQRSGIKITRFPYEEPDHLNLRIQATNGRLTGELEYYCNATDLGDLGNRLSDFDGKLGNEICYELGSEDPAVRFAYHLLLRITPVNSCGHCEMRIRMRNNREGLENELCEFSMETYAADINRLGKLLIEFGRLEHLELEWNVNDGRLFAEHESAFR